MPHDPVFAEVQYFFMAKLQQGDKALALISVFGAPDATLHRESSGALLVCQYRGIAALEVISVKQITSAVAMVPFKDPSSGKFFVCEKIGLDVAYLSGSQEEGPTA